ncbi:MAG TPA: hypothetical protein VEF03_13500 [Candidatus Binataceae bacterium]|nr:hypothetical protein [Candidatus Binataceae bacterium]
MILIFYAFAREVAPLKRRLKSRKPLDAGMLRGFRVENGRSEFVFIASGMGPNRAGETVRAACETYSGIEFILSIGVAGALSAGLKTGDIIVANRIMSDTGEKVDVIECAQAADRFESALRAAKIPFSAGAILTSGTPLLDGREKRAAKERSGAIAVDMESAAIAAEALSRGIPFAVVRAIIDELEDEVFGADLPDSEGNVGAGAVAAYFARNPGAILRVPRMMVNLSRATRALADAVEALIVPSANETGRAGRTNRPTIRRR